MDDTLKDVYVTMLSKNIEWGTDSRVAEARWILIDLGVPLTLEVITDGLSEWTEWAKWEDQ